MGVNNFFMFFEPTPPVDIDENTVLFSGDVGFDITLDTVLPVLKEGKTIVFDSYGGDLWEGLKIYDAIKSLGIDVEVGILGSCMSAATLPLCAATKRWTTPNSRLLIHNAWSWVVGDAATHKKEADALAEENLGAAKIYAELTGATVDEMLALMNEERVMRADEMLQRGFVNEIKNQKKEEMDSKELEKKLKAQEESIMKKIQAFFRKNSIPKNAVLQDVAGNEFDFGDEVEDLEQVEVGTTATLDGAPASGEYPFPNGKTYVFVDGVVTEIRDTEEGGNDEEVEEVKEEVEELKEEVEELKEELAAVNASFRKQLKAIKAEFSALKNAYNDEPPIPPAGPGGDDPERKPKKGFVYNGRK
jgi:ATP-dependent protease ClpP protease subunit